MTPLDPVVATGRIYRVGPDSTRRPLAGCCQSQCSSDAALNSPAWRRALWIALGVNGGMFLAEIVAGASAGSAALQADAIDFLGDSANYAISLGVAGMALTWRARAAWLKGWSLGLLGALVLVSTAWRALAGGLPEAATMGVVGVVALAANALVALMLYRFRSGDANMRSVWICSRNDAIGNIAVVAAAMGVFGTGTAWPDLIVAAIMAALAVGVGWQIVRQARAELGGAPVIPRRTEVNPLVRRGFSDPSPDLPSSPIAPPRPMA